MISSSDAWIIGKNGSKRLNPKYHFVGKVEMSMPNMIVSASDKQKSSYRGDINELSRPTKRQIVDHFFDESGKRNKKMVAYLGIEKSTKK